MNLSKYYINGMSCDKCVETINKALINIGGIKAIDINLEENYAYISFDSSILNDDKIIKIIEDLGFNIKDKEIINND